MGSKMAGQVRHLKVKGGRFYARTGLTAPEGSAERAVLAKQIMRAEIEALQRTIERDQGDYGGHPADPIVKAPANAIDTPPTLFRSRRCSRITSYPGRHLGSTRTARRRGKPPFCT